MGGGVTNEEDRHRRYTVHVLDVHDDVPASKNERNDSRAWPNRRIEEFFRSESVENERLTSREGTHARLHIRRRLRDSSFAASTYRI